MGNTSKILLQVVWRVGTRSKTTLQKDARGQQKSTNDTWESPKAGKYWEDHCRESIQKCGFEPVPGWECMYMNIKLKLFLNVYVDDFKMSGLTTSMPPAWKSLKQYLDIDEPTEYNTYLGCNVHSIDLDPALARTRSEAFQSIFGEQLSSASFTLPQKERILDSQKEIQNIWKKKQN